MCGSAILGLIPVGNQPRGRIAGLYVLEVEGDLAASLLENVVEADTGIDAIGRSLNLGVVQSIRRAEMVPAVKGGCGCQPRTFGAAGFELEPGGRGLAQGQFRAFNAVFDVCFLIPTGGQADFDVIIEPVTNRAAGGHGVRVVESRGEFIAHHQKDRMTRAQIAVHQHAVVRG